MKTPLTLEFDGSKPRSVRAEYRLGQKSFGRVLETTADVAFVQGPSTARGGRHPDRFAGRLSIVRFTRSASVGVSPLSGCELLPRWLSTTAFNAVELDGAKSPVRSGIQGTWRSIPPLNSLVEVVRLVRVPEHLGSDSVPEHGSNAASLIGERWKSPVSSRIFVRYDPLPPYI